MQRILKFFQDPQNFLQYLRTNLRTSFCSFVVMINDLLWLVIYYNHYYKNGLFIKFE